MQFPEELTQEMLEEAMKPAHTRNNRLLPKRVFSHSIPQIGKTSGLNIYKGTRMTIQLAHRQSMFAWAFYNELSFQCSVKLKLGGVATEVKAPSGLRRST